MKFVAKMASAVHAIGACHPVPVMFKTGGKSSTSTCACSDIMIARKDFLQQTFDNNRSHTAHDPGAKIFASQGVPLDAT